jgi:hypothetical protein
MKKSWVAIDTVPLPEKPARFEIPMDLLEEFAGEPRIVVRHPWIIGIPVPPDVLRKLEKNEVLLKDLGKKYDLMIVPK